MLIIAPRSQLSLPNISLASCVLSVQYHLWERELKFKSSLRKQLRRATSVGLQNLDPGRLPSQLSDANPWVRHLPFPVTTNTKKSSTTSLVLQVETTLNTSASGRALAPL